MKLSYIRSACQPKFFKSLRALSNLEYGHYKTGLYAGDIARHTHACIYLQFAIHVFFWKKIFTIN